MSDVIEEIEVPVWWNNGVKMVRRSALSPEHPESTYQYIKNELDLKPEDYGVYKEEKQCQK